MNNEVFLNNFLGIFRKTLRKTMNKELSNQSLFKKSYTKELGLNST